MAAATATSLLRLSLPPPSRPTAANRLLSQSPGHRRHHPHLGFRFHAISPPWRQETLGATPLRPNLRSRPMGKGGQDEGKRRDGSGSSGSEPATPTFPAWVRTPSECLAELGVSADRGLSAEEAAARLRCYGPNELERHAAPSVWKLVLEQFDDTLVRILLAAAVVSFVLALYDGAEGGEVGATAFVEPLVIFLILIINAVVGVWQESNAEKALEALKEIQCARGSPEASREFRAVRLVSSSGFVLGFLDSEGILRESAWIWGGREGSEWRCRVTSSPWWCSSPRSPRPPRSPIQGSRRGSFLGGHSRVETPAVGAVNVDRGTVSFARARPLLL